MKKILSILISIIIVGFLSWKFFSEKDNTVTLKNITIREEGDGQKNKTQDLPDDYENIKSQIANKYQNIIPYVWSESAPGVITKLNIDERVLALTFDACGGPGKNGYDANLINYLSKEKIPATFFIGGQWIDANPEAFEDISTDPLFEIENHGTKHIPCSVNGKSAYNIQGENNPGEIVDEIELNARKIESLTGRRPKFYRAATTFTDEICPQIAQNLSYKIVSFSVNGDGGATFTKEQIKNTLLRAPSGSIVIAHMNHPEKETAEGIILVIPELIREGFKFVKLEDYELK